MCDINFRVWDNLEKAYLNEKDITIDSLGNIFIIEGYDHNDSELWYARILPDSDNKRYIIEQDTGLKDRNGTKINEGDVLVDDAGEPIEYWTVKLSEGAFVGECAGVTEALFELTQLEVAGNIHENSELVEEK
nr:MAG TPA: YopX protein [Caudoviricetes sp.]